MFNFYFFKLILYENFFFIVDSLRYSNIFIWYCCTVGLIGIIFTCVRLTRLLLKLQRIKAKKKKSGSKTFLCNGDRKFLFHRKHNLSIYSYFVGNYFDNLDFFIIFNFSEF